MTTFHPRHSTSITANAVVVVVLFGAQLFVGCSGRPARIEPPDLDPSAAAAEAVASFDTSGDARLSAQELEACPGLKAGAQAVDTNRDKQLTSEEIAARIRQWSEGQVALVAVNCTVIKNGRPLPGATVTLLPEKFLGPNIKSASGVSDSTGRVELSVPGVPVSALAYCGFYRVEISKKEGGKETIAARYNRESVLGEEITEGDKSRVEGLVFDVSAQ
jgi:hypothetical protein